MVYLVTGKRNAGKTHYAITLASELRAVGKDVISIDGDEYRAVMSNKDYSDEGRLRNLIGAAVLAQGYEKQGYVVILSFVAPKQEWREEMQAYWKESKVIYLPGGTLWENTTYESPEEVVRKRWRRIKVKKLAIQTITYRLFIVACYFAFCFIIFGDGVRAFEFSIKWSVVNLCLYYGFHYLWAKRNKLGKE